MCINGDGNPIVEASCAVVAVFVLLRENSTSTVLLYQAYAGLDQSYVFFAPPASATSVFSQGIYGVFARTRLLARPTLRDVTSHETKISHGLARKVSAIPHLRQLLRHYTAIFYCLRQYSVLKIGLEFLARPGLRDETKVSRSRLASRLARSRSETHLYHDRTNFPQHR